MSTEKKVPIPARIYNASQDGHVAGTVDIIDDNKNKTQDTINAEVDTTLAIHQNEINSLSRQNYVSVNAYSALPSTGSVDTIYRVSSWDGNANSGAGVTDVTKYSEYAWYNGAYILMDVKSQIGEVFDISAYNSNTKYVDLAAALGNGGANVPASIRRGGMSVKFVLSSDNKYVQYRLMHTLNNTSTASNDFVNTENWQGVDDVPTAGSENLVKSGGVRKAIDYEINKFGYPFVTDGTLSSNGWITSEGNYHYVLPVKANDTLTIVTKQTATRTSLFSLISEDGYVSPDNPERIIGNTIVQANSSYSIVIPSNGNLIVSHTINNVDASPLSIYINGVDVLKSIQDTFKETNEIVETSQIDGNPIYNYVLGNGAKYVLISGYIGYDSRWYHVGVDGNESILFPNHFNSILIKSNQSATSVVTFLSAYDKPFTNTYAQTVSQVVVNANTERTIMVPQGCKYIVIAKRINSNDRLPDNIICDGTYDILSEENLKDLYAEVNGKTDAILFSGRFGTDIRWYIDSSGSSHYEIPVKEGDAINLLGNSVNTCLITYLTSHEDAVDGQAATNVLAGWNGGSDYKNIQIDEQASLTVPEGATLLYVTNIINGISRMVSSVMVNGNNPLIPNGIVQEIERLSDNILNNAPHMTEPFIFKADFDSMKNINADGWDVALNKRSISNASALGISNALTVDVCNTTKGRQWIIDFSIEDGGVAYFGSMYSQYSQIAGAMSLFSIDLSAGKLYGHNKATSVSEIPSFLNSVDIPNASGYIGKKMRIVLYKEFSSSKASIYDIITGEKIAETVAGGFLFDKPKCFSTGTALTVYEITMRTKVSDSRNCLMLMMGDSITDGAAATTYQNCYAAKIAANFNDFLVINEGRSAGTIDVICEKIQSEVKSLRPQYVMVTVGTNGGNTKEKLRKLINDLVSLGCRPVLNHIPCIGVSGRNTEDINTIIDEVIAEYDFYIPCIRFDVATAVDRYPIVDVQHPTTISGLSTRIDISLFDEDLIHPNDSGHEAMYLQAMEDFPELFDFF